MILWVLASKWLQITSVGEDVEKKEHMYIILLVGTDAATMENSTGVSLKTKNRTTIWSNNFTAGYIQAKIKP